MIYSLVTKRSGYSETLYIWLMEEEEKAVAKVAKTIRKVALVVLVVAAVVLTLSLVVA